MPDTGRKLLSRLQALVLTLTILDPSRGASRLLADGPSRVVSGEPVRHRCLV